MSHAVGLTDPESRIACVADIGYVCRTVKQAGAVPLAAVAGRGKLIYHNFGVGYMKGA